ncbi:MAG: pectin acetylesterase-family hydrolase [Polyangiales bacterium]
MVSLFACSDEGTAPPPDEQGEDEDDGEPMASVDSGRPRLDATIDARTPGVDSSVDAAKPDAAVVVDAAVRDSGLLPFEANGKPIDALAKQWTWVPFPDSYCRDGSNAGVAVNFNGPKDDLMIFLEGGGACFEGLSCLANPTTAQQKPRADVGIFDRTNSANPLRDFNFVYVPYCTGDVHAGTNANAAVPGVLGTQKFVGRLNMEAYLKRVVPTFKTAKRVVLTGISAGGFGAASNAVLVQRAFPDVKVTLIDDSGPPMSSKVVASCLQKQWRELWGLDKSILADCGSDCGNKDDFLFDYALHLAKTYSDRAAGLIETAQDGVISGFFGAGLNNCTGIVLVTPVPGADFQKGLLEFRDAMKAYPNFGTWYPEGTQHTWLSSESYYTGTIGSKKLTDWIADILAGKTAHVGL